VKKSIAISLSLMLFATIVAPVSASPKNIKSEVIYQKQEVKDLNLLYDKAQKGITEIDQKHFAKNAEIQNQTTGLTYKAKTFATTQLIKKEKMANGEVVESYATTSFAVIPELNADLTDTASQASTLAPSNYDGWKYGQTWDSTSSCKAYATIYWAFVYNGTQKHVKLLSVDGGWTLSGVTIASDYVNMGQTGLSSWTGYAEQVTTFYPSGLTYSYSAPGSWVPVWADGVSIVGSSAYTTVRSRSGSTWSFWNTVNVY